MTDQALTPDGFPRELTGDHSSLPPINEENAPFFQQAALLIFATSLLSGLIGMILFYDRDIGINIGLYTILLLAGGISILKALDKKAYWKHLSFGISAIVFAGFSAYTANPDLKFVNMLVVLGSLIVALEYATIKVFLGGSWKHVAGTYTYLGLISWFDAPMRVLWNVNQSLKNIRLEHDRLAHLQSFVRGLIITLPVILVFGLLLGSADVIFDKYITDFFQFILPDDLESLVGRTLAMGILMWGTMIAYRMMVFPISYKPWEQSRSTTQDKDEGWRLLTLAKTEIVMLLGSVDALFLAFIAIQARYLFGGEANIEAQGYTYSEYARRGFFEILAVSVMTLLLVLAVQLMSRPSEQRKLYFKVLVGVMIGLTMLLLVASFQRMNLYIENYGFTRLRVETQIFIVWLALLLIVMLADVFRHQKWFWRAAVVVGLGYIFSLNALNMDAFIADKNIDRFHATGKLDLDYLLYDLSYDAVPSIVELLDDPTLSDKKRKVLQTGLGYSLWRLDLDQEDRTWLDFHLGNYRAWQALDEQRDELEGYVKARDFHSEQ